MHINENLQTESGVGLNSQHHSTLKMQLNSIQFKQNPVLAWEPKITPWLGHKKLKTVNINN